MPFCQEDNTSIYYETQGSGHPVILLSGYACDHTYWLPIVDKLARDSQVITVDNRGSGQTTDQGEPLSIELMANDVLKLMQHLKIDKAHIVGSSMGGMIAQVFAATHPDKAGKLCLMNTSAKGRLAVIESFRAILTLRKQNLDVASLLDISVPWLFGEMFLRQKNQLEMIKQLILANPYFQSLPDQVRQFNALELFDGRSLLNKITADTLIIHGDEDIIALSSEALFLKESIQHAILARMECAHTPILECFAAFSKVLLNFLAS